MVESAFMVFLETIGMAFLFKIKKLLFWSLRMFVISIAPIILLLLIRSRRIYNRAISKYGEAYKHGRRTSKSLKLNRLYSTPKGENNIVKEGKIVSYILIDRNEDKLDEIDFNKLDKLSKDYKENLHSRFLIRHNVYRDLAVYEIPFSEHSDLAGDVVTDIWNFENVGGVLTKNIKPLIENFKVKEEDKDKINVDTIKHFAPLVSSSIQCDSLHRKTIRLNNLIKEPSEQQ